MGKGSFFPVNLKLFTPQKLAEVYPSQTPTPTPKPLSFSEMNALYGPCVALPTLMYHHVQNMEEAKGKNQASLTVDTQTFRQQMQYLKDRGYRSAYMSDVVNFFEKAAVITPKKYSDYL